MNVNKNNEIIIEQDKNIALKVIDFSKKYSRKSNYAVHKASFEVKIGEFHGFIGANGAGKTTTIKSLIGAYAKFEGNISVFGHKYSSIQAKKRIGYIPENTRFPKGLNACNYVKHMAHLSGMPLKEAKHFAIKTLTEVGLGPIMYKNPRNFSSGQKKKVLLAQALSSNPDLLIMDEPAANLDPKARDDFFNNLKNLQKKGKAIFISSHILAELEKFVDSITILDGGKIVYTGKIEKITTNKNLKYEIDFFEIEDLNKFENFLKKLEIKFKKIETKLEISFVKKENINKSLYFINKSKLKLKNFTKINQSLQEIYNTFIKKGSVDTLLF